MRHLTKAHGTVLSMFYDYPKGYIIAWPKCVPTGAFLLQHGKWFFNPADTDGSTDFLLDTTICEDLEEEKIIIPDSILDDNEYRAQIACGTVKYRVFHLNEKFRGVLRKDFIDYLDKSPIVWL